MTKRLIEFNVGDPKSNQQTASRVDCVITINNAERDNASASTQASTQASTPTPTLTREIESEPDIYFDPRVNISLTPKSRAIPASSTAERFIVVSRQPTVTAEEIENNIEFIKKLNTILTNTLTNDNRKLVANMIDTTGKVILSGQDLCELIALMLSVESSQINITYSEPPIISSCTKIKIIPFKEILNIKIDNQDFRSVQNEAYNILTDTYKISLSTVYI